MALALPRGRKGPIRGAGAFEGGCLGRAPRLPARRPLRRRRALRPCAAACGGRAGLRRARPGPGPAAGARLRARPRPGKGMPPGESAVSRGGLAAAAGRARRWLSAAAVGGGMKGAVARAAARRAGLHAREQVASAGAAGECRERRHARGWRGGAKRGFEHLWGGRGRGTWRRRAENGGSAGPGDRARAPAHHGGARPARGGAGGRRGRGGRSRPPGRARGAGIQNEHGAGVRGAPITVLPGPGSAVTPRRPSAPRSRRR
jgi:hypothetical protein